MLMMASANHTNNTGDIVNTRFGLTIGVTGILLFLVVSVILLLMIFVYKTYKTTFQRLILYYVILGLWAEFTYALQIFGVFSDKRWVCIIEEYLRFSSVITWYTYVVAISNFSLLLVPCLMRGRPVSKKSSRCVERICVVSTVIIALVVTGVVEVEYLGALCLSQEPIIRHSVIILYMSIFIGINLEVVLVSLSLSVFFHFIRQRINSRQTALLLRNSIYHLGINAFLMAVYCIGAAYNIYIESQALISAVVISIWEILVVLSVGLSVIIQAILCIQTSTERNTCCKRCCYVIQYQHYAVIEGKNINTSTATNPTSSRVSQPSYTNFAVPYTGDFTQITTSINNCYNGETNEQRPLTE